MFDFEMARDNVQATRRVRAFTRSRVYPQRKDTLKEKRPLRKKKRKNDPMHPKNKRKKKRKKKDLMQANLPA
jgi:hypothetical protein